MYDFVSLRSRVASLAHIREASVSDRVNDGNYGPCPAGAVAVLCNPLSNSTYIRLPQHRQLTVSVRGSDGRRHHSDSKVPGAVFHSDSKVPGAVFHTDTKVRGAVFHSVWQTLISCVFAHL